MDGPSTLNHDGPAYNGLPPPNYFNSPINPMMNMPSTSNGPLPQMQFHQQQGFPSPMEAPNGNFYGVNQMPPQYGIQQSQPNYFNGPMPPGMNGFPPEYPQMPPRVPSSASAQARVSPFGQPSMHTIPNGNGPMTPTYGIPGQVKTPTSGMFISNGGITPNTHGFVFTSEMANQAAMEVGQSKHQNIAQWHNQNSGMSTPTSLNSNGARKSGGMKNSPSYAPATNARKRKGSQAERQNPTPSPQLQHQPGSVPEFKQPMSNHAPGSVPDNSIMQFVADKQIKNESAISSANERDPIKQLELMAQESDNFSSTSKLSDQLSETNSKPPNDSRERAIKLAKLDQIQKKIGMEEPRQPSYSPQIPPHYRFIPNGMMPSNGPYPMPSNQPPNPMYYNPPPMYTSNGPMPPLSMDINNPGMQPANFPGYMQPRFPMMPQSNGAMNMPRPEMFNQWQENMPQPLTNLDSRVPSQKINYYGSSNGQPQMMPSSSITPTLKNGT